MARISGVDIPDNKKARVSLTYIYGIGPKVAYNILSTLKIDPDKKLKELSEGQVQQIRNILDESYTVEGELRQVVFRNIKRLKDIRCYRGVRHKIGLPVRGQRTRVNARTRKGKARAVGGLKQKITKT